MKNLNKLMLIGNFTADPEQKSTENGTSLATFSIATSRTFKDSGGNQKSISQFHRCVAWRHLSEVIVKHAQKGTLAYVEGELQYQTYTKDGIKMTAAEVVVSSFIICDRGKWGDNQDGYRPKQTGGGF